MGKTPHPTPHTPHPAPTKNFLPQTLLKCVLAYNRYKISTTRIKWLLILLLVSRVLSVLTWQKSF
ncbi:MAG: hypothetical protein GPI90_19890 [Microcystis aeruginosa K13-05]|uniref:hypothetical protein n=1 Tax=Microcystis sp. LE19-10.1B TaxID=3016428 RepID=UPI0008FFD63F|nr:hypothetical protein [Microcystis sp. LE19-10.1B]MCZ8028017.1 hypothetical protein [Microcystis sp. LE19-10.1B]MCZ8362521.1 hypothetical protein [Microcystis sp. LE19-251.1A]NCR82684.1 hypothetical protein [Microcystis aeruginosa K13-10]NCR86760.1 hypothetical protein [Microcystis aeruginosa K13-05]